ncbi:MAG: phosphate/phosphite/phosphonate ABC transporter substrate-binding protein [Anaerolineaceae bacterium]|nr:phosphate/phosphite/phosphonate ABC transporter substrate-binding protein [Anaerolineaceae bacterium]MBN2677186.1 phosphate/phosphite/phosphonate ABC transporter substrate-binding protein [Anaerolineaceae bacterium]
MRKTAYVVIALLVALSMLLTACGTTATEAPAATTAPVVVATEAPVEAPAEVAWGTADNPIIMAMAPSATSETLTVGGAAIADKLKELTGYEFEVIIPTSYAALVEAMGSGNAHIGWLPPLAYLLASQKGYAEVVASTLRRGSDTYGFQLIANKDAGFTPYFDADTNTVTGDAKTALPQLDGKNVCWTDPLSASGYVLPSGVVADAGAKVKKTAFLTGHPQIVVALYSYVGGGKANICDFGATYIDARTDASLAELTDVTDKVIVVWRSDSFIPNDNVSVAADMPDDVKAKIVEALLTLGSTEDGIEILAAAGYQIDGLKAVDDTFYDSLRVYLEASGLDVTTLVK